MNGTGNGSRSWLSLVPVMLGIGGAIIGVAGWLFAEFSMIKDNINKNDDRLIKLEALTVSPQEHSALRTLVEGNSRMLAAFDARLTHVEQDQKDMRDELKRQK